MKLKQLIFGVVLFIVLWTCCRPKTTIESFKQDMLINYKDKLDLFEEISLIRNEKYISQILTASKYFDLRISNLFDESINQTEIYNLYISVLGKKDIEVSIIYNKDTTAFNFSEAIFSFDNSGNLLLDGKKENSSFSFLKGLNIPTIIRNDSVFKFEYWTMEFVSQGDFNLIEEYTRNLDIDINLLRKTISTLKSINCKAINAYLEELEVEYNVTNQEYRPWYKFKYVFGKRYTQALKNDTSLRGFVELLSDSTCIYIDKISGTLHVPE